MRWRSWSRFWALRRRRETEDWPPPTAGMGVVEVSKSATGGAAVPLARLGRGEVLGEIAAFDGGPRSATAVAGVVAETRLLAWDMPGFQRYLAARPPAALIILSGLLRK